MVPGSDLGSYLGSNTSLSNDLISDASETSDNELPNDVKTSTSSVSKRKMTAAKEKHILLKKLVIKSSILHISYTNLDS